MQIVIDIDEDKYHWLKENNPKAKKDSIVGAIVWGKPLLKGHGRLIDENDIMENIVQVQEEPDYQHNGEDWRVGLILAGDCVFDAQTIIEADREKEDENS